jgi:alkyl hydroperoxide reductase subunit AhpC
MPTIVRNPAPAWKADAVVNEEFTTIASSDLAGKYYVLLFYPLDWCVAGAGCGAPRLWPLRGSARGMPRPWRPTPVLLVPPLPALVLQDVRCGPRRRCPVLAQPPTHALSLHVLPFARPPPPFAPRAVCPTEIIAFSERAAEFRALGVEVMGISVDSKHSHLAWIQAPRGKGGLGKMNIPLLADLSKSIARDFGVLVENPADADFGIALRGTVIVDGKGIVRSVTINDTAVGRSVDETLRLLQAFQYADTHDGEVCPAGWKPGAYRGTGRGEVAEADRRRRSAQKDLLECVRDALVNSSRLLAALSAGSKTMASDPKKSKEYFAAVNSQ